MEEENGGRGGRGAARRWKKARVIYHKTLVTASLKDRAIERQILSDQMDHTHLQNIENRFNFTRA